MLGAGSSIGHSAGVFPSIEGFFSKAKEMNLQSGENFKLLADYTLKILGRNIFVSRDNTDIESLFTYIEIELERNPSPDLIKVRLHLLRLIQDVLISLESKVNVNNGEYKLLVSQLNQSDTIITFNWDLLLDKYLSHKELLESRYNKKKIGNLKNAHYDQFLMSLSGFGEQTWQGVSIQSPYESWSPDNGFYLKAHGSIDWAYCSNDVCRASRKVFPILKPSKIHYCSECHEPLQILIIPPVLNKGYRQYPIIRKLWNLAAREMVTVDELIIWGYSLPPTDFYASWLLRQAREAPLSKLVLINPEVVSKKAGKVMLGVKFIRKFYDLFRRKLPKESITIYESFEDYTSNNNVLIKYNLKEPRESYKFI